VIPTYWLASVPMAIRDAYQWWLSLSPDAKRRLVENPDGPVPDDLVPEVTGKGALLTGAWMPDAQAGPDGFYLPREYVEWLRTVQLERRAVKAEEAFQAAMAELNAKGAPLEAADEQRLFDLMNEAATTWKAWQDRVAWQMQQP
jgi:hypothetical protein